MGDVGSSPERTFGKPSDPPSSLSTVITPDLADLQAAVVGQVTVAFAARATLAHDEAARVTTRVEANWLRRHYFPAGRPSLK